MIHSEEKRVVDEIIHELENNDVWSIGNRYGDCFKVFREDEGHASGMMLKIDNKTGWFCMSGKVALESPFNFKFSPKMSRKLCRYILKYLKNSKKRKDKIRKKEDMESLKELYSRPKDGSLYVHDKKEII